MQLLLRQGRHQLCRSSGRPPSRNLSRLGINLNLNEGRRKKEEVRRKKEEGEIP
ncbi:MAG: hypothetical protein ACRC62_13920 [Microcoleus sp.]